MSFGSWKVIHGECLLQFLRQGHPRCGGQRGPEVEWSVCLFDRATKEFSDSFDDIQQTISSPELTMEVLWHTEHIRASQHVSTRCHSTWFWLQESVGPAGASMWVVSFCVNLDASWSLDSGEKTKLSRTVPSASNTSLLRKSCHKVVCEGRAWSGLVVLRFFCRTCFTAFKSAMPQYGRRVAITVGLERKERGQLCSSSMFCCWLHKSETDAHFIHLWLWPQHLLKSLGVLVFKAYSALLNQILASTDAVFKYFSKPSGLPAARLGHALGVLGMNLTEDQDPWQQFLLLSCCVNQWMFVPAPVEVNLPPRSGREAFDGSGSSGVHRPQDVSQSHWGLAVFFSLKLMLLQMRWNIFSDQKEKTLELNQKINTAMNNLKFCHVLWSHEFWSPHDVQRWEALQGCDSASCMVQEELGKPIPKVQAKW